MLQSYPQAIASTGTALVTFLGPPNVALTWSLTGSGTLTNASAYTDSQGVGMAIFTPSSADQLARVSVSYES